MEKLSSRTALEPVPITGSEVLFSTSSMPKSGGYVGASETTDAKGTGFSSIISSLVSDETFCKIL